MRFTLFMMPVVALALVFFMFPGLDLATTNYFYSPEAGFYLKKNPFVKFVHKPLVPGIVVAFILGAIYFGIKKLKEVKSFHPKHYMKIIYVMLVCITGPGLIVNATLKDNFHRARPAQIKEFGGKWDFTPAFVIGNPDQCDTNCSFVSGHASVGFMFFGLAFIMQGRRRQLMMATATALGLSFGLVRIIQGGHFLSDVIFSGVFTYITAYVLFKVLKPLEKRYEHSTVSK